MNWSIGRTSLTVATVAVFAVLAACTAPSDSHTEPNANAALGRASMAAKRTTTTVRRSATGTTPISTTTVPRTSPTTTTVVPGSSTSGGPSSGPASSYITPGTRLGVGGCPIYPDDNVFHATITSLPVRSDSAAVLAAMGGARLTVRAGFSASIWEGSRLGLPINVVDSRTTPSVDVIGGLYNYLSDLSGHAIPASPRIEGWPGMAWDRHLLLVDSATCTSSEFFYVSPPWMNFAGRWAAETAVKVDLQTNLPRARGTATASGTSMLAGLTRFDEVASGEIDHVIGVAIPTIKTGVVNWPATGTDGRSSDPNAPAMGSWLRLRSDVDLSKLRPQARVIARAMQRHGAMVVDTTVSGIALSGEPDLRWDDQDLATLGGLSAADFEIVDPTPMKIADGSYQIR